MQGIAVAREISVTVAEGVTETETETEAEAEAEADSVRDLDRAILSVDTEVFTRKVI